MSQTQGHWQCPKCGPTEASTDGPAAVTCAHCGGILTPHDWRVAPASGGFRRASRPAVPVPVTAGSLHFAALRQSLEAVEDYHG